MDDGKRVAQVEGNDTASNNTTKPRFCVKQNRAEDAPVRVVYAERAGFRTGIMQPDLGHNWALQDRGWTQHPLAFYVVRTARWVDLPRLTFIYNLRWVNHPKEETAKVKCANGGRRDDPRTAMAQPSSSAARGDLLAGMGASTDFVYLCPDRFDATLRDVPLGGVVTDVQFHSAKDAATCPPDYDLLVPSGIPTARQGVYLFAGWREPTLRDRPADMVQDVLVNATGPETLVDRLSMRRNGGDTPMKDISSASCDFLDDNQR